MMKSKAVKSKTKELNFVVIRINDADLKRIRSKAKRYAETNLSAWIRYTSTVYTPKKGEKIPLEVQRTRKAS